MNLDVHTVHSGSEGDTFSVQIAGSAAAKTLSATVPAAVAGKPVEAGIGSFETTLQEMAATLADGAPPTWRVRLDAAAKGISAKVDDDAASASLQSLTLRNAGASGDKDVTAEELGLDTVTVRVTRGLIAALQAHKAKANKAQQPVAEAQQAAPAGPSAPSPRIALDRIALSGPGHLQFSDTTVQPPVDIEVNLDKLAVQHIDTAKTDTHTRFDLAGSLGDLSKFEVSGWATPLDERRDFDVSAHAQGVQLHKFSGYAAQALGLVIDSGTLEADVDAAATDGRLKALVGGVVRNLDFAKPDTSQTANVAKGNLPIGLVLALLEDEDRKIELRVPVSGNLDAPQFDLSQAIERALTGAVRNVVRGALDVVFAPALIAKALVSGDETDEISKPLSFRPGSAELAAKERESTSRLADLLEKRPKLAVEICGRATAQDASNLRTRRLNKAMLRSTEPGGSVPPFDQRSSEQTVESARPQLEQLAADRTRAVRRQLLDRGVTPSQISECRPTVDAADQGRPGVVVSLQAG